MIHAPHEERDLVGGVWRLPVDPGQRREVGPDAEVLLVLRGQDHDADRRILADLLEGGRELLHQVFGDRVVAFAMHDDTRDSPAAFDVYKFSHQAVKSGMPPATSITAPVM